MKNQQIKRALTLSYLMLTLPCVAAQTETKEMAKVPTAFASAATGKTTRAATALRKRSLKVSQGSAAPTTDSLTTASPTSDVSPSTSPLASAAGSCSSITPSLALPASDTPSAAAAVSTASSSSAQTPTPSWDEQPVGQKNYVVAPGKIPSSAQVLHAKGLSTFALVVEGDNMKDLASALQASAAKLELKQKMAFLQRLNHATKMLNREQERTKKLQIAIAERLAKRQENVAKKAREAATNSSISASNTTKTLEEIATLRATLAMKPFTAANRRHPHYTQEKKAELSDTVLISAEMLHASSSSLSSSSSSSSSSTAQQPCADAAPARSGFKSLFGF